jgi:hypothetical protein
MKTLSKKIEDAFGKAITAMVGLTVLFACVAICVRLFKWAVAP